MLFSVFRILLWIEITNCLKLNILHSNGAMNYYLQVYQILNSIYNLYNEPIILMHKQKRKSMLTSSEICTYYTKNKWNRKRAEVFL